VMIEVSDTGSGMSAGTLEHIFEPFFTTKDVGKGSGLGLSMVFGFLRQSNGHINVYSEVGAGTTFRLYLPRATAESSPSQAIVTKPPMEKGTGEAILVVEDNPAVRRVVLRQLNELGYRTLESSGAREALDILGREQVHLMFTDIVMAGGIDGVELGRIAIDRWPALKVVLTSGFPQARLDDSDTLKCLWLLSKPYSQAELAAMLRAVLDS
jgi:CheY-like chemotaxis protein